MTDSSGEDCPSIVAEKPKTRTKIFAYYSVDWQRSSSRDQTDQMSLQINSCLYFHNEENVDDPIDCEEIRRDGCGYVIIYPNENPSIYNFDRPKQFLLTSDQIYPSSKEGFFFRICINFDRFPLCHCAESAAREREKETSGVSTLISFWCWKVKFSISLLLLLLINLISMWMCRRSAGSMHLTFQLVTLSLFAALAVGFPFYQLTSSFWLRRAWNFIRTHTSLSSPFFFSCVCTS